ncbi:MAG: hypothetical protein AB9895_01930 [Negativicutes bacterium]
MSFEGWREKNRVVAFFATAQDESERKWGKEATCKEYLQVHFSREYAIKYSLSAGRFVCQKPVAGILAGILGGLRVRFAERPQSFFQQILPASPANFAASIQGNRPFWQKTASVCEGDSEPFPKWKGLKRRGLRETGGRG